MKKNILLFGAISLLFLAIGAYFGIKQFPAKAPENSAATLSLYSQTLPDVHGQAQQLSQWRNKKLVVNFWATWCAPCVEEMPDLTLLQTELANKNVQIIGIGIDSATNIKEF